MFDWVLNMALKSVYEIWTLWLESNRNIEFNGVQEFLLEFICLDLTFSRVGVKKNLENALVWLEKAAENGHRESDSRIVAVRKELIKQKESLKIHYVNAEPFGNIFNPLNNMLSLNKSSSLPNSQYKDSRFHSRRNETLLEESKSVRQQDDFIVFME